MPADQAIYTANNLYREFVYKFNSHHLTYKAEVLLASIIYEHEIICDYIPIRVEGFCGMLTIDEDEKSILVNVNHIRQRRMFTISHELGHYFLHRHLQSQFIDEHKNIKEDASNMINNTINHFEVEANLFASEIMVPELVLQSMLNFKYNFFRISKITGCSYTCLKWRLVRYLYEKYTIEDRVAELLVEDYREASIKKKPETAIIFRLENVSNPYESAPLLLERKEKEKETKQYYWF